MVGDEVDDGPLPGLGVAMAKHLGHVMLQLERAVAARGCKRHLPTIGHRLADRFHGVLLDDEDRKVALPEPAVLVVEPTHTGPGSAWRTVDQALVEITGKIDHVPAKLVLLAQGAEHGGDA